jgi:hypothetical protein
MFGEEYDKDILKIPMSNNTVSRYIRDMSQDFESQVIANVTEAVFVPSSWTSQLTSLKKLNSQHSEGLFVMETSLNNFYFANQSQILQKAEIFSMLSTVVLVLTICHGLVTHSLTH